MVTLDQLHAKLRRKLSHLRSIKYRLESEEFQLLYETATKEQKEALNEIVDKSDSFKLKIWIDEVFNQQKPTHLHMLTVRELRLLAAKKRVPYYARKPKWELVTILEKLKK